MWRFGMTSVWPWAMGKPSENATANPLSKRMRLFSRRQKGQSGWSMRGIASTPKVDGEQWRAHLPLEDPNYRAYYPGPYKPALLCSFAVCSVDSDELNFLHATFDPGWT